MINKVLAEIKAYRFLTEVDVDPSDSGKITAVIRYKFLSSDGWRTLGFMLANFHKDHYELKWIRFDLPLDSREFFELSGIRAIKKKISLIWGYDLMQEFEERVERTLLKT